MNYNTGFFKESYQFDFPVMIHSFLIHFIERKLVSDSVLSEEGSPRFTSYQLILKSYYSSEQKVLFLNASSLDTLLDELTNRISQVGLDSPVSGFDLVGIPDSVSSDVLHAIDSASNRFVC